MSDLNEELEDRWRHRRQKSYNWPRLIVMIAILAALIYGMGMLQKMGNTTVEPSAEVQDATVDQPQEQAP